MELFELCERDLGNDYQIHIVNGAMELDRASGSLVLDRAGPFVAPFHVYWLFGTPIVTDEFRGRLEAKFPELTYRAVIKRTIVELPWETWDFADPDPWAEAHTSEDEELAEISGGPGDYLWLLDHSPTAAAAMPNLWEVVAPSRPLVVERSPDRRRRVARVSSGEYRGIFTYPKNNGGFIVDRPTRDWLRKAAGPWVSFQRLRIVEAE